MSEWHYRIGDEEYGPISEQDLRKKIESGNLSPDTLVFRNGLTDWLEAGRCKEFSPENLKENHSDRRETHPDKTTDPKPEPLFPWPARFSDSQTDYPPASRNRLFSWCLGIIVVAVAAGLLVKFTGINFDGRFTRDSLPLFQASDASHPSLKKTRNYWLALRKIAKPANEGLKKLQPGEYPLNRNNELDFTRFTMKDFENLKAYKLAKAQIAAGVALKIEALPEAGVDPALLHYKLELWEVWSLIERANLDYAKITRDLQEQRACFASPEGYALRFGKPRAGPSEIEAKYHENEEQINEKITEWKALSQRTTAATENISKREGEVKKLLSLRYGTEFN